MAIHFHQTRFSLPLGGRTMDTSIDRLPFVVDCWLFFLQPCDQSGSKTSVVLMCTSIGHLCVSMWHSKACLDILIDCPLSLIMIRSALADTQSWRFSLWAQPQHPCLVCMNILCLLFHSLGSDKLEKLSRVTHGRQECKWFDKINYKLFD